MFLKKAIRDWGRTGFYEADGYFIGGPAPWMSNEAERSATGYRHTAATTTEVGRVAADEHGGPGGAGKGCLAAASIAEVSASAAEDSVASTACIYSNIVPHAYLFGDASDGGKMYSSMQAAKAACSKDIRCGGTLSRSCDEKSNGTSGCKLFQTRSGMSEEGCHAGVPCKNRLPHTLPEPHSLGWAEQQNAYPITNAQACGHKPSAGPPPSPHPADHGRTAFTHASAVWATLADADPNATWVYVSVVTLATRVVLSSSVLLLLLLVVLVLVLVVVVVVVLGHHHNLTRVCVVVVTCRACSKPGPGCAPSLHQLGHPVSPRSNR